MLKGSVERIKVYGKSLEGNLEEDSITRNVSVYLPPGYKISEGKRYPAIYFLHGYTDSDSQWYGFTKHWINMPPVIDSVFAVGRADEMIVVTPNSWMKI